MAQAGGYKQINNNGCIYLLEKNRGNNKLVDFNLYLRGVRDKAVLAERRRRNKEINLCSGVDIEYLEALRVDMRLFACALAKKLGISIKDMRDYLSFDKVCPLSFAQNWELTIWSCGAKS